MTEGMKERSGPEIIPHELDKADLLQHAWRFTWHVCPASSSSSLLSDPSFSATSSALQSLFSLQFSSPSDPSNSCRVLSVALRQEKSENFWIIHLLTLEQTYNNWENFLIFQETFNYYRQCSINFLWWWLRSRAKNWKQEIISKWTLVAFLILRTSRCSSADYLFRFLFLRCIHIRTVCGTE